MPRDFEHSHVSLYCTNSHPPITMTDGGFYSLKGAGACITVIGYKCPRCRRVLFVSNENPLILHSSIPLADIDATS